LNGLKRKCPQATYLHSFLLGRAGNGKEITRGFCTRTGLERGLPGWRNFAGGGNSQGVEENGKGKKCWLK